MDGRLCCQGERRLMEVYLAPVLLTVMALAAQVRKNRQADIAMLVTTFTVIALIAGLRWYVDADYASYVEMYGENPPLSEFNGDSIAGLYGEPGYLFLTAIFKSFGVGFALLALTCAFFSVVLKAIVVSRLSRHASFALCLYLCLHFITIEFIQMRWAVATAFLVLGFCLQYEKKHKAAILSFALAIAFHYFSILYWIVALLVTAKGYRRFYLLFAAALLGALFLKIDNFSWLLISESDIYVLRRLTQHATTDIESQIGLFSYAKLLMFPIVYAGCVWWRPSFPWKTDRLNLFLFKLSFVSLSATLFLTFLPILHLRATVIADFFAIIWIVNALDHALSVHERTLSFVGLGGLYCTWYVVDLSNYINSGRILEYQTWLSRLR